ncbi:LacI family DNA-binding transcriptional regulator [Paraferrimonas sedimenticola]|uniref:Transcriptional regulator n=1 Tax=Paraferrimonas sedimenticola TaxID=375674 RepID=A0AA37W2B5_9GAMM|nr:LacI family DNA-binding transcriptional regulator [Paraferrimonas sedimenticola]GLP97632.1 transcriptional regulator [Paraferrimonas sedimenticola]
MATIYQVSKKAGVSLATVSRVVNNNPKVSENTRLKVLKAMQELGYRPNATAQSLASNRSNSIGIVVSELEGPFFGPMMCEIEANFRSANKHVIIAPGNSDELQEKSAIDFLISRNCDALILYVDAVSDDYLAELAKGDTPIVLINRQVSSIADRCINLDNEQGGYLATKALLDLGHQHIAYIAGPQWKVDARSRFDGHCRALKEAGIEFDSSLFYEGDYHESSGSEGMLYLHKTGRPFSAVVCGNDQMASGAMSAARDCGLRLPEDLSVVGFDDALFARYMHPKLTTVVNPVKEFGAQAAKWVLANVYDKSKVETQTVFEPELRIRDSVQPR